MRPVGEGLLRRRPGRSAGGAALGKDKDLRNPLGDVQGLVDDLRAKERLIQRKVLSLFLRERLRYTRYAVRACATCAGPDSRVRLGRNRTTGWGSTTGLLWCGSVWHCPNCSARIRAERAKVIGEVLRYHLARGGGAVFLTATMPHSYEMPLEDTWKTVTEGWSAMVRGAPWKRIKARYGLCGVIRAFEVTCGCNGWHPHLHVVLLTEQRMSIRQMLAFEEFTKDRWDRWITRKGYKKPHEVHGLDVQLIKDEAGIGQYVSKIEFEVARGDLKEGREKGATPWELLRVAAGQVVPEVSVGVDVAWSRWQEYMKVSLGKRLITWDDDARALRTVVTGAEEERTDEEIVSDMDDFEPVAEVTAPLWRVIDHSPKLYADVMMSLRSASLPDVLAVLMGYGVRVRVTPDGGGDGLPLLDLADSG